MINLVSKSILGRFMMNLGFCDGKSALLSLVKTFDSILAVSEGFCDLKQVDLELKICRGNSDHHKSRLLSVIHRSLSLNSKFLSNGSEDDKWNQIGCNKFNLHLVKKHSGLPEKQSQIS
ncbi:hypothetical protein L2E82_32085 [Cichorium intybus]|uniref:Uncharacterized protein n=1 Tax=Cichorium intybus TaxID=13427 RepID=A0ACB9BH08_CICIN|nr:hypothetical protein L2E82_32085 [Cichorium intybus]